MSWHSSIWSPNSHVKVHNKSSDTVAVFSFNYSDVVYVSFRSKAVLAPGEQAILKGLSAGAGKITIGVAVAVARESGGGVFDWGAALASADVCQGCMMGKPRYKLRLRNVADNTECFLKDNDGSLEITGQGVTKCVCGDTTEVESGSDTGMGIMRVIQGCMAVGAGGAPIAAKVVAYSAKKAINMGENKVQECREAVKQDVRDVVNDAAEKADEVMERAEGRVDDVVDRNVEKMMKEVQQAVDQTAERTNEMIEQTAERVDEVVDRSMGKVRREVQETVAETEAKIQRDLVSFGLHSAFALGTFVSACRFFNLDYFHAMAAVSFPVIVARWLEPRWLKAN